MNWFKGLLLGGILGGIAGILFAPKSGEDMRRDLGDKATDLSQRMKDQYGTAVEKGKSKYDDMRRQFGRAKDQMGEATDTLKESYVRG